jgi:hypothetical protein
MNTHAQAATDSATILQAILAHLDTKLDSKLGAISRRLNALEDSHNPTWPTNFNTYPEDNTMQSEHTRLPRDTTTTTTSLTTATPISSPHLNPCK